MNNKNMEKSYGIYLAYFFMALIAQNALRALFRGEYNAMVTAVLMLGMTVIPFVVAKRMNINLPWFVFFLVALALWIHTAGYVQGYYTTFYPYYDKIAHIVSGTAVAVLGFLGVIFVDKYMKMNLNTWFIIFFTIIFGMAMGAAWEKAASGDGVMLFPPARRAGAADLDGHIRRRPRCCRSRALPRPRPTRSAPASVQRGR